MAGVSAAAGVMNSLLSKLSALLGDEYKLLKRVRKEIEFLKRELSTMNALLLMLADMENLDPLAKDWRNKVRELSYDIEDCIDLFMHRLGNGDAKARFMRKTVRRLKTLWVRHEIASQIQDLKARVEEETKRRERYRVDYAISKPLIMDMDRRLPVHLAEAKGLVAIDGPRDQIIKLLMDKDMHLKVVSVVGCGGLSKTTLAMQVYHKIGGDFHCRASMSVSRTLDLKKLLKDMLYQIDQYEYCHSKMWDEEQLVRKLRHTLKGKRYLIVIDDIWTTKDWKLVASVLPENNNCSRIIVTTRVSDVAKLCCSNFGDQLYDMAPLGDVNSRRLFLKRIFNTEDSCPTQLEEVSNKILKKCGGLPLAIITLASLLANKSESKHQWELVLHSIGSTLQNGDELQGIREILLLSYHDLPYKLKTCLLSMSIYPEDYEIDRVQLTWRWIAEGFISENMGQSLEQISNNYFNELVNGSLIQPIGIGVYGTARACRIHDMVLELITFLATEENFVTMLDINKCNSLPEKVRRLSLHGNYAEGHRAIQATTSSKLHVRSMCAFGSKKIPQLLGFHALRVLDLDGCEWLENHHVRDIGGLFQLKYLRLRLAKISTVPEGIGTLKYLETLDLRECYHIRQLPPTIIQLRKLVRLQVEFYVVFPSKVGDMESLEELSDVYYCNKPVEFVQQLGKLTKLRRLGIGYQQLLEKCDDIGKCNDIFVSSLGNLGRHNLRSLSINCEDFMVNSLIGSHLTYLQELNIGSTISRVPNGIAALSNLAELSIKLAWMQEEDIRDLRALPALLCLRLILSHSPKGEIIIGDNGFRYLKDLFIQCDGGGMCVMFAPCAMPQLQRLHFVFKARGAASKGGGFDTGIQHLSRLRDVDILIGCDGATKSDVEAAETAIGSAVSLHTNGPTLRIKRYWDLMEPYKKKVEEVGISTRRVGDWRGMPSDPHPNLCSRGTLGFHPHPRQTQFRILNSYDERDMKLKLQQQ